MASTPVQGDRESPAPTAEETSDVAVLDEVVVKQQRRLRRILAGYVNDVPPLSSRIVRIFTSSTFTGQCFK